MITLPDSDITITDIFCGAGGSSQGARRVAGTRIKLAVNHWKRAVETHSANFPDTDHDCVDLQITDPRRYRRTRMLLISPDCRRHSNGSGTRRNDRRQLSFWDGGPEDPSHIRSRATMNEVWKFAEHHRYDIIIVENVVEVTKWDEFGKWWEELTDRLGYHGQILCLNSMFFHPTPQSRDRIYFVFSRKGIKPPELTFTPKAWCGKCEKDVDAVQSWKPKAKVSRIGKYRTQYLYCCPKCATVVEPYYYCAYNVVDWSIQAERIGDRKKPLEEKTMNRIKLGLARFASQPLMMGMAGNLGQQKEFPLTEAYPTQTGTPTFALAVPPPLVVETSYSHAKNNRSVPVIAPSPTQTARQSLALVTPPLPYLVGIGQVSAAPRPVSEPYPTQTTCQSMGVVTPPAFIIDHIDEYRLRSLSSPISTITAQGNHQSVVTLPPAMMIEMYRTGSGRGLDEALATVTAGGNHHGLLEMPHHFLASYYGTDTGHSLAEPVPTVPTLDKHALVGAEIKVEDCTFRMLQPKEVGRAMAFEEDYQVFGNSKEKVRQYGQAVTPPVMEWLVSRCIEVLK
jgi:DNA (cytosine-5)-methyltransferase 1